MQVNDLRSDSENSRIEVANDDGVVILSYLWPNPTKAHAAEIASQRLESMDFDQADIDDVVSSINALP